MTDSIRILACILCVIVAVCYMITAVQIAKLFLARTPWTAFVKNLNMGRMLGCIGTAILALTVLEGHIVRWHEPLSVRAPLTVVAGSILIWAWWHSSRFVFRAQIIPPEDKDGLD